MHAPNATNPPNAQRYAANSVPNAALGSHAYRLWLGRRGKSGMTPAFGAVNCGTILLMRQAMCGPQPARATGNYSATRSLLRPPRPQNLPVYCRETSTLAGSNATACGRLAA